MLKNRTAFVTGASRGIGRAIALELARNGADVAICYSSNDAAAEAVCQEIRNLGRQAEAYRCDVSNFQQCDDVVKAAVAHFGQLDILVNNAGITRDNLLLMMKEDEFDQVIATNLKGRFQHDEACWRSLFETETGDHYQYFFGFRFDGQCRAGKLCGGQSRVNRPDQNSGQRAGTTGNYLQCHCTGIYYH